MFSVENLRLSGDILRTGYFLKSLLNKFDSTQIDKTFCFFCPDDNLT